MFRFERAKRVWPGLTVFMLLTLILSACDGGQARGSLGAPQRLPASAIGAAQSAPVATVKPSGNQAPVAQVKATATAQMPMDHSSMGQMPMGPTPAAATTS